MTTSTSISNLSTLQREIKSVHGAWVKFFEGETKIDAKTSDWFKAALATLGPCKGKDKAGNETVKPWGLKPLIVAVFSGDVKLVPSEIMQVLSATRADKAKAKGEEPTTEGKILNRWSSMLSTLQAEPKGEPVKADELTTIKAALARLLESREEETVSMLAELGFMDDRA